MKKNFALIFTLLIVALVIIVVKINTMKNTKQQVLKFNKEYEYYCNKEILGTDITTVINMATNNNEKYKIKKDENNLYIQDEENSIKIFVKMKYTEKVYPMESFYSAGIGDFTKYFGEIKFKSSEKTYHNNGKIASITFEELSD